MTVQQPTPRIMRIREVEYVVGLKKSAIMVRINQGTFPKPVPLGSWNCQGWLESEVDQWLADRIAERSQS